MKRNMKDVIDKLQEDVSEQHRLAGELKRSMELQAALTDIFSHGRVRCQFWCVPISQIPVADIKRRSHGLSHVVDNIPAKYFRVEIRNESGDIVHRCPASDLPESLWPSVIRR